MLNRAGLGCSVPKGSVLGSRRQKQPFERQHFLKRLPEPQGQRSFRPSFSSSSFRPWTTRTPRLTCVSDGYPRRRLLIVSKKMAVRRIVHGSCVAWRTSGSVDVLPIDTAVRKRFATDAHPRAGHRPVTRLSGALSGGDRWSFPTDFSGRRPRRAGLLLRPSPADPTGDSGGPAVRREAEGDHAVQARFETHRNGCVW